MHKNKSESDLKHDNNCSSKNVKSNDDILNNQDIISNDSNNAENSLDNAFVSDVASVDTSEDVVSQIDGLKAKISELNDLYLRAQADIQNMQRRNMEEVKKARDYAMSNFAKDMVVIKDYLEMALKDESGDFNALKMGVDLTLKQVVQAFERQKLEEIYPQAHDKLDPNLHQAMQAVEEEGFQADTVVQVMQKGYVLNGRMLRPAMVVVAK